MMKEDIFVFKTNIQTAEQATKLKALADVEGVTDWSTDLDDFDRILRVVGRGIRSDKNYPDYREAGILL